MKIYLATWLHEPEQGRAMTVVGKKERLLSFWHTRERESEFGQYITTGRNENLPGRIRAPHPGK